MLTVLLGLAFALQSGAQGPELEIELEGQSLASLPGTVSAWGDNSEGQSTVPAGLTGVRAITAGYNHSVALKCDGTVVAWGQSDYRQLRVPVGLTGVQAVSASMYQTIALKQDGTAVAWGWNPYGGVPAGLSQLRAVAAGAYFGAGLKTNGTVVAWGTNSGGQQFIPPGLTNVQAIATGYWHVLALKGDGTVVAWGGNHAGQAVVPPGLSNVVSIAAGEGHSVALRNDGNVVAWGANFSGQCNVPVGLTGVTAISAGVGHTMAVRSDGTVIAWGDNALNQATVPLSVSGVGMVGAGAGHSLALAGAPEHVMFGEVPAGSSRVKAFTLRNTGTLPLVLSSIASGGLNAGEFIVSTAGMATTVAPGGLTTFTVTFIPPSQGVRSATLEIRSSDADESRVFLELSGAGLSTNAGLESLAVSTGLLTPVFSTPATSYSLAVSAGQSTMTVTPVASVLPALIRVRMNGGAFAAVASGTASVALPLQYGGNAVDIEVTAEDGATRRTYTILATRTEGPEIALEKEEGTPLPATQLSSVVAWGYNEGGQCNVPAGLTDAVSVSAGATHTVALRSNGTIVQWGNSVWENNQLNFPSGLTGVKAVVAGYAHTLALKQDGTVVAWGYNSDGQDTVPAGLANVTAVAAGYKHSLALLAGGTVVGWGSNGVGQTQIPPGLSHVQAIDAGGGSQSLALKTDGTVVSWGNWYSGVAGPPAGLSGVRAISTGSMHSLALKYDGTVIAWGENEWGGEWFGHGSVPAGLAGVGGLAAGQLHNLVLRNDGTVTAWGRNVFGESTPPPGLANVVAVSAGGSHSVALLRALPRVEFGTVAIGGSSVQTLRIRNSGPASLDIASVSIIEGDTAEFSVNTAGMSGEVPAATGETTFSVSFHPAAGGGRGAILRVASDDPNNGSYDLKLIGSGPVTPSAYVTWAAGIPLNGAASAPGVVPHRDGVSNLLKFAFNLDATGPDTTVLTAGSGTRGLPVTSLLPGGILRLEYLRRCHSGLIYTPLRSDSLTNFTPTTGTPVVTMVDSEWERVVIDEPSSSPSPARVFLTVSVSLP